MLSPPIDNFKDPEGLLQVERIIGSATLDTEYITNFYFNHFVSIVMPDTLMTPDELTNDFITKTDYYKVSNIFISDLINKPFLKYFVCNGKLTLMSINTLIDCDNTIAITPKGELVLNIDKETYQSLGIDGRISHFGAKLKNRYIIMVDLKNPNLQSDPIKLAKLKSKLKILERFTIILSWGPNDNNICPSSIAKYIHDLGHDISVCHTDFKSHITYSTKVPVVDFEKAEKEDIVDFLEWLGMLSIEGDLETDSPSDYVNSYTIPVPNTELGQVKCLQWKGFFSSEQIQELIKKYKEYNSKNNKAWISIHVQGFSDAPLTWANEEQNFFTNGDNSYTMIFNQKDCLFCLFKTCRKRYK